MLSVPRERVVAVVQCRANSSRLPGKAFLMIGGRPLLARVIQRARAANTIHEVVVATTNTGADDATVDLATRLGAAVFRGSEDDVLDRFAVAARRHSADIVVRITADDPFKDPHVTDLVVNRLLDDESIEYASNTIAPTWPEGLDVEALRVGALERAWREAHDPVDREHVTTYIWRHPDLFRLHSVESDRNLSHLRWTIDYPEDLEFARTVYERLGDDVFGMEAILALVQEEPALLDLPRRVLRDAAYRAQLADRHDAKNE